MPSHHAVTLLLVDVILRWSPGKQNDNENGIYCRTRNFRVCLYIAYLACGSASLYIKTLYFFITVLALSAATTVANIKIRYDAKLPNTLYLGHA